MRGARLFREAVYYLARVTLTVEYALALYQAKCPHPSVTVYFRVIATTTCDGRDLASDLEATGQLHKVCKSCHKVVEARPVTVASVAYDYGFLFEFGETIGLQPGDGIEYEVGVEVGEKEKREGVGDR